jgi:hypothetical protein
MGQRPDRGGAAGARCILQMADPDDLSFQVARLLSIARDLPDMSHHERIFALARVRDFLRHRLIPYVRTKETVVYPAWAEMVGYRDAPVPLIHDHDAISARVDQLMRTDADDTAALQELLYGLHALIEVSFDKEEDLRLPVLDS